MFSAISRSRWRGFLEGIDGVGENGRLQIRHKGIAIDDIHRTLEQAGDVAHHCDSILDTMRHNPGVIEGVLGEEELFALDELLSKLSHGSRRVEREKYDDLGEAA